MKFKKGDKVQCITSQFDDEFTKGKLYTVRYHDSEDWVMVIDNNGEVNGLKSSLFELYKDDLQSYFYKGVVI